MGGLSVELEQARAEVSDALRAAKHWGLYQNALQRAESAEAELLASRLALGFERGWSDAATRALAEARDVTPREPRKPRSLRVEDDLWDAALKKADERGEVLSEEIRNFLQRYVARKNKRS